MIELTQSQKDKMGRLNNEIVDVLDKSECSVLEAAFVLENICDRIKTTAMAPKKPK